VAKSAASIERALLRAPLLRRREVLALPCPVPEESGIHGWYFATAPPGVPTRGCHRRSGAWLLYLGISPSRAGTKQNLRRRIRGHLRGNASGSTLRLSLGCLLTRSLGIRLQKVGSRLHFGDGEQALDEWLDANGRVCWVTHARPWAVESSLIARLSLPLNLDHNGAHPFAAELSTRRWKARAKARNG